MVRSPASPEPVAAAIRSAMTAAVPVVTAANIRPMTEVVDDTIADPRFTTTRVGGFAGLALILAAIGIYGVITYSVAQRIHEIGVRVALGASTGNVLRLVVGEGMRVAAAGVVIGAAAAAALGRLATQLLFGVTA